MSPPDAVVGHYAAQQRQAEATAILTRRQWRRMTAEDLDRSWVEIVARLAAIVGAAQLGAARAGAAYVPLALDDDQAVDVNAARFAGVASDGRPLDSLLYGAVVRVREGFGRGLKPVEALQSGQQWLDTLVRTQVADASRGAAGVAITARPKVGYTRMVAPPCCQRCAVLAGKFFKWNAGFLRHPKCDCRHTPAKADDWRGKSSSVDPDQIKDLTIAQRKAIADGADPNQVINAHRAGARSKDGMTTSEGTTRRGLAGQRGRRQRLTPEGIYRSSAGNREQAIQLLKDHGYLL